MGLDVKYFERWRRLFEVRTGTVKVKANKSYPAEYVPTAQVAEYPYIVINSGRLNWVHIDVDLPPGLPVADDETPQLMLKRIAFDPAPYDHLNIPYPAFSVLSRRSYHLAWPLLRSLPREPSARAWNFYRNTRGKLALALGGDLACPSNSVSMKNPFYDRNFAQRYPANPCHLADLLVDGILPARSAFLEEIAYETGQRNLATFRKALEYSQAHPGASYEQLLDFIESFQANQTDPPLPRAENQGIVASILSNRHYRVRAQRNYGAMNLPTLRGTGLPPEQMLAAIRERQSKGAQFSCALRVSKKSAALRDAVAAMENEGKRITGGELAARAKVSIAYVRKSVRISDGVVSWRE
jgi:hypothetical protein